MYMYVLRKLRRIIKYVLPDNGIIAYNISFKNLICINKYEFITYHTYGKIGLFSLPFT